jgi:gliding motility-associated-like protein
MCWQGYKKFYIFESGNYNMRTRLLLTGIIFLTAFRVSAQNVNPIGTTPVNGQNPLAPANVRTINDPVSPTDGSTFLGPTYSNSQCGLNYTTASNKIGQRFVISCCPATNGVVQPAAFTIAGIPSTAVIQKAFVWCESSGNGVAITINVTNPFSVSANFAMTMIGQDVDKCWGYQGSYTYRADVTALIAGNGNYMISGFPVDPSAALHSNDVDGATMMVIWSDPTQTWQGDIVIWDGSTVINGGTTTQTINNFTACSGTVNNARAFMAEGDLQGIGSQLTLNGVFPITCVEDWWNWIDVPTTVTPGQTTSAFGNSSGGDCYNFCVMGLYWQSNCQTCCASPFTLAMDSIPSQCAASNGTATANPIGGNGPFTYVWNTNPPQTGQTATGLSPGVYTVTVNDSMGCSHTDSVTVLGTGTLTATTSQTNNLCFGDTTGTATYTPTTGSPPYTYTWSPNVSTTATAINLGAGTYTVDVTDHFGCTSSHTFTITEPPNVPIVSSITGTTPICTGSSAQLVASATGGAPPYTYNWLSPLSTNDSIIVSPATTTTYTVVVTDACNTAPDSATFVVNVNALPVISFSGNDLNGCVPVCDTFTLSSNPAVASCSWNFGDNSTGITNPAYHCYLNSGPYSVTAHVVDVNGCKDSLTLTNYINVYPFPNADFGFISPNPAPLEESTIAIDDLSTGGDTCKWDFGDGNQLIVVGCGDVSNAYVNIGTYQVTQIVVNSNGCADTITYDVIIVPNTSIYVPNAFTPNANGNNDVFFVYGEYVADFHLMVFDRWGNLIFESNDQAKGWDGKANGGKYLAQEDTYVYVVTYSEEYNGHKHKVIGHVNLIR